MKRASESFWRIRLSFRLLFLAEGAKRSSPSPVFVQFRRLADDSGGLLQLGYDWLPFCAEGQPAQAMEDGETAP
jgi:hypothetical protein